MSTINGRACVVNDKPVDAVYQNGVKVYGYNLLLGKGEFRHHSNGLDPWARRHIK